MKISQVAITCYFCNGQGFFYDGTSANSPTGMWWGSTSSAADRCKACKGTGTLLIEKAE